MQTLSHIVCLHYWVPIGSYLLALQRKLDGLRDTWFVFDGTLVLLMCVDTGMALFIDGHGVMYIIMETFPVTLI